MNDLLHRHGNQFGDTGIQFDIDIDNPSLAVVDEGNGATVIADIPLVQIGHKTTGNISPSTSLSGLAPIVATTTAGSHLTILATYDTSIT